IDWMTGNISDRGVSRPARGGPGCAAGSCTEKTSRLEAQGGGHDKALRMGGRSTQSGITEERGKAGGGVEPRCPAIGRAQRTSYVIARFTIPSRHHVLISAIFDDFKIGHPFNCAHCAFEDLRPGQAGVGAAPDGSLETCHSEIGSAEKNQVGIIAAKTHGVEIGFKQRTLVRTKRSPSSV